MENIVAMQIGAKEKSVFPVGGCNAPNACNFPPQPFFYFLPPLESLVLGIAYVSYQPLYLCPSPKYALTPSNNNYVPFTNRSAQITVVWLFDSLGHNIQWIIWAPK